MGILHRLAGELAPHFAPETLRRARSYAADGSVLDLDVQRQDDSLVEVVAAVAGSRGATYVVHVAAAVVDDRTLTLESSCSCPVRWQCKHAAAVALTLATTAQAAQPRSWQDDVDTLLSELGELGETGGSGAGVALQFSVLAPGPRRTSHQRPGALRLRPLRPGARQRWVKAGLGWSDVHTALVRGTYDVAQLHVLDRMRAAVMGTGAYWHHDLDPDLTAFGRPVVALLREAAEVGVTFVAVDPLRSVEVSPTPATVAADVSTDPGAGPVSPERGTTVRVGVAHQGRLWSGDQVQVYGDPAHTVVVDEDGHAVVLDLERPLTGGPLRALRRGSPLTLPDAAAPEVSDVLRRLAAVVPLASQDGTVVVPDRLAPTMRVTVTWASADAAEVAWSWVYGAHPPVPIDAVTTLAAVPGGRDRAAEQTLLARVDPPPEQGRLTVTGVDALHLALLQLPAWRLVEGLDVVEVDPPDFREADDGPQITFTSPTAPSGPDGPDGPATSDGRTDWLDLEVAITVEGEPVALVSVLAALTRGEEHLVLPSGLYVRTDRPEFTALDDVVRAAAQLHERGGDGDGDGRADGATVRVGHQDLGLWAQLADLGIVDAQADAWVRRARALRDLVDLPRPEPTGLVSTLRDYQLDGFHWLAFLWRHRLGGILADEMGLGKTLQVLALVAHARAEEPEAPPFLVVAPTSVVSAWESEARRHAPGLRVRAVTATTAKLGARLGDVAATADVVVTTYTLLRLEAEAYAAVAWSGLVLDEAQWVKNHQSRAYAAVRGIDAPFRLAVTGTPFENRLLELWSLLSVVTPGLYPQPRSFVTHVVQPVEKEGDADALRRFTRRIKPFVLRRSKELVAAELPAKQEQVLDVALSPAHRRLYDTHLARERQRILGLVEDFDHHRVAILAALTRLRQLALDPALVDADHDRVGSAKIDVLVDHLREISAEGHRALVFSTFTGFLGRVRERLVREGITFAYLDGSTQRRSRVVEGFRNGDASAFLISLKAGGVGLTLTEADYVFVLDPWWNPAAETQAVDRAHRIGQLRTVMVYRMVSTDTVEDKVMALKTRKAALFAQVVDGEAGLADTITAEDIRGLFD